LRAGALLVAEATGVGEGGQGCTGVLKYVHVFTHTCGRCGKVQAGAPVVAEATGVGLGGQRCTGVLRVGTCAHMCSHVWPVWGGAGWV
jgi:hypothetical protein